MRIDRRRALHGLAAAAFAASCRRRDDALLVDAAASTKDALSEIIGAYAARVRASFGGSSELARQIEAGARCDVFLSADEAQMDRLEKAGRVSARRDLLRNRLVVIVPSASKVALRGPADLARLAHVATGNPASVPVGVYAKAWLEKAGVWNDVAPHVVATVDVRAALAAVEAESVDAAIVYATDARLSQTTRVALEVPADDAPPIRYPIAVIDGSRAGAEFVAFAASDASRAVFARYGFESP